MEQQTGKKESTELRRQIGAALQELDTQEIDAILALIGYLKLARDGYFPFPAHLFPVAPSSDLRSP